MLVLGRDYLWPPDELDRVHELARARLSEVCQLDGVREVPGFAEFVEGEIAILESRIPGVRSSSHREAGMSLA